MIEIILEFDSKNVIHNTMSSKSYFVLTLLVWLAHVTIT